MNLIHPDFADKKEVVKQEIVKKKFKWDINSA